jgi:hypothetical protein
MGCSADVTANQRPLVSVLNLYYLVLLIEEAEQREVKGVGPAPLLASLDKSLFMKEGKTYPKVLPSRPKPRNEKPALSIACDVIGC